MSHPKLCRDLSSGPGREAVGLFYFFILFFNNFYLELGKWNKSVQGVEICEVDFISHPLFFFFNMYCFTNLYVPGSISGPSFWSSWCFQQSGLTFHLLEATKSKSSRLYLLWVSWIVLANKSKEGLYTWYWIFVVFGSWKKQCQPRWEKLYVYIYTLKWFDFDSCVWLCVCFIYM